jgi:GAF domain-containing protein
MHAITNEIRQQSQQLLEKAIQNDQANMGNIQLYSPSTQTLYILVQKGFRKNFLDYFQTVRTFDTSACGRAAGNAAPVVIKDTMQDIGFIQHRTIALSAGFRAVKSVPVLSRSNELLGMISTHHRDVLFKNNVEVLQHISAELAILFESLETRTEVSFA